MVYLTESDALQALDRDNEISIDLETGGLSPWTDPIAVIILRGHQSGAEAVLHVRGALSDRLLRFLERPILLVGHNITAFDLGFLHTAGLDIWKPKWWDTLVSECVVSSSGRRGVSASLKASLSRRVGVSITKQQDHSGWMNPELTEAQLAYAVEDIRHIARLKDAHIEQASKDGCLDHLRLEADIIPAVAQMMCNGFPIDLTKLERFVFDKRRESTQLERELNDDVDGKVNWASHIQVKRVFANRYEVVLPSTDIETLKATEYDYYGLPAGNLAAKLVRWRHATKIVRMYTDDWVGKFVVKGRVHSRLWQCSAETGRFASTDPNLQQIPATMREIFGGLPGHKFVWVDYSQLEVRIAAALAGDKLMLSLLADTAVDIHRAVAGAVHNIPPEQVSKAQRQIAKIQTFRILFGGGWIGLQRTVKREGVLLTDAQSRRVVQGFLGKFADIRGMRDRAISLAKTRKVVVVKTPLGMKRVLAGPSLTSTRILNTAVQGGAAVGLKCAIRTAMRAGLARQFCGTVHDELDAVVPAADAREYASALSQAMLIGMQEVTDAPIAMEVTIDDYWHK